VSHPQELSEQELQRACDYILLRHDESPLARQLAYALKQRLTAPVPGEAEKAFTQWWGDKGFKLVRTSDNAFMPASSVAMTAWNAAIEWTRRTRQPDSMLSTRPCDAATNSNATPQPQLAIAEGYKQFALAVLMESREHLGSDIDGGWLQDKAEEFGLLKRVTVTEPCGEICSCAEYDDFPQECLQIAAAPSQESK
jgi:hypothetical protein